MSPSLADLFPEIFPLIVAHIPLHTTPATVRSLSLTNRHVSAATLPLVWGCLVIEDERHFNNFVKKISSDLKFGHGVRELHIMLRSLSQNRFVDGSFNAVKILEETIISGALPNMHTIGLCAILSGYANECPDFWRNVRKYCPRLHRLLLLDIYGVGPTESISGEFKWLQSSGIHQLAEISSLSLRICNRDFLNDICSSLLLHLGAWAQSLETLNLSLMPQEDLHLSKFLSLQFPSLRSLTIDACPIHQTEEAMSFWTRHPTLETIAIFTGEKYSQWFMDPLPQAFLLNLRCFKAHFREVRVLAHILPQLRSLAICDSINAQVPYLLRSVVDGGLPNLKSLCIRQTASSSTRNIKIEGALWYEAQDGTFHDGCEGSIKRQGRASKRDFLKEYMHSIVRGAPNIEELCLISLPSLTDLVGLSSDFSGFKNLKRIYIEVATTYEDEVWDKIHANASLVLAQQSGLASLESVTNFTPDFPFAVAKIQRDPDGYPDEVVMDRGGGMQIGNEDVAFLYADPDMWCCVE